MAQSSSGYRSNRWRKRAETSGKHGKRTNVNQDLGVLARVNKKKKPKNKMYASVHEAFEAARKEKT